MRAIIGITCLLLGAGMLSCQVEGVAWTEIARPTVAWVRTVDGWERPTTWHLSAIEPPRLHPLVVAAGQALVSALALAVGVRKTR